VFLGNALFPRLAHKSRWWQRSGRGVLLYVGFNTVLLFLIRQFLLPRLKEWGAQAEEQRRALREQLGREPSDEELVAHRLR
jgi:hypothetical protein